MGDLTQVKETLKSAKDTVVRAEDKASGSGKTGSEYEQGSAP